MTTTKPRITITLSQRSYAILKSISVCSGQPMSSFVSEMLESAGPTLERMAATFQKIKTAQDNERSRFLTNLDEAQAALEPVVMNAVGQFDLFLAQIGEAADGLGVPASAGATCSSAAASSPLTNRGDTPTSAHAIKSSRSKALAGFSKKEVLKKSSVSKTHKPKGKTHAV